MLQTKQWNQKQSRDQSRRRVIVSYRHTDMSHWNKDGWSRQHDVFLDIHYLKLGDRGRSQSSFKFPTPHISELKLNEGEALIELLCEKNRYKILLHSSFKCPKTKWKIMTTTCKTDKLQWRGESCQKWKHKLYSMLKDAANWHPAITSNYCVCVILVVF